MKTLLVGACVLFGLSACSLPEMDSVLGGRQPATMQSATGSGVLADPMRMDTIAYADAYCRKDDEAAVAATQKLIVANPNHPRALLNYGLSLDLAGRGVAAYRVLDRLAKADHTMPAVLRCGDAFVYSGSVTEVAQRRAFDVKTALTALGMAMPLPSPEQVNAGRDVVFQLAALAPPPESSTLEPTRNSVPEATHVMAKQAAAPSHRNAQRNNPAKAGRHHFVHLGSYKTSKTLEKGWRNLRKRFGKILGAQTKAVSKVNLGKKKGRYLRLGVDVANAETARSICKRLKAGGQYCVVLRARKS